MSKRAFVLFLFYKFPTKNYNIGFSLKFSSKH